MLTHFDMFENVVAQRSDAQTGIWLSGLDNIAADALRLRGGYFEPPPIVCYLDRGMGAAIRRARTRLPGGGSNPVAVVKIPRERLVGSGIASSLFHEVGHQAAALLGLVGNPCGRSCARLRMAAGLMASSGVCGSDGFRRLSPTFGQSRAPELLRRWDLSTW